jgi:hypothetical protein
MTGCLFFAIARGKLLQNKLIHVHCTTKSAPVPVSPVLVNKFFLFPAIYYEDFILKILKNVFPIFRRSIVKIPV